MDVTGLTNDEIKIKVKEVYELFMLINEEYSFIPEEQKTKYKKIK